MSFHDHGKRTIIGTAFDMPARDPQQFPETVRVGRSRHLAQAEIDALCQQNVHQPYPVPQGAPVRKWVKASENPVRSPTSNNRSRA